MKEVQETRIRELRMRGCSCCGTPQTVLFRSLPEKVVESSPELLSGIQALITMAIIYFYSAQEAMEYSALSVG